MDAGADLFHLSVAVTDSPQTALSGRDDAESEFIGTDDFLAGRNLATNVR